MSLKTRTIQGAFWVALAMMASNLLSFLVTLILARLLTPGDFGLMAIANLVIYTLGMVRTMGLSQALVYKSEEIEKAADTTLILVVSFGVVSCLAAILSAPFVATFFKETRATPLIQALAATLVISSLGLVPEAFLTIRLDFRRKFVADIFPLLGYGLITLGLAAVGAGVWSLVIGKVAEAIIRVSLIWRLIEWRPTARFDWSVGKEILLYGKDITASSILAIFFLNIDNAFISRMLGTSQLGYYTFAFSLATLPVLFAQQIADTVTFPAYVHVRDHADTLRRAYLKSLRLVTTAAFPTNLGLLAVASICVPVLYGDKWRPSIILLQILSLYGIARAVGGTPSTVLRSIGKQHLLPRFVALYVAIAALTLSTAIRLQETRGAAIVMTALITIGALVWMLFVNHYLVISFKQLVRAVAPQGIASIFMAIIVQLISHFLTSSVYSLVLLISIGIITYTGILILVTRGKAIDDIKEMIQPIIANHRRIKRVENYQDVTG